VVLYNGSQRWNSATQLSDLIIDLPGGLDRYKLESEYLILDEGTYSLSELEPLNNLVAAIFRLENSQSREDIIRVIDNLQQWLSSPEMDNTRKSFVIWLKRVLMPTKKEDEPIQEINDLTEIKAMLAQTVSKMTAPWIQQGQEIGEKNGEKKLLLLQIAHRFDQETSSKAQSLITPIQSTKVLENIGQWLLDCKDGDEFLKLVNSL